MRPTSRLLVHTIDYQETVVDVLPSLPSGGVQLGGLSTILVDSQFVLGATANVAEVTSTIGDGVPD